MSTLFMLSCDCLLKPRHGRGVTFNPYPVRKKWRRTVLTRFRSVEYTATRFQLQALNLLPCVSRYYLHAALPLSYFPISPAARPGNLQKLAMRNKVAADGRI
jgi:hypothetical protein